MEVKKLQWTCGMSILVFGETTTYIPDEAGEALAALGWIA
jgi:uncharacterized protein with HEPN domain